MVSNTVFSLVSFAAYLPVNLIVTRYMVEELGIGIFGLWSALTIIINFQGLLDLGISAPLIKYVSQYSAEGDSDHVNVALATAMVFYFVVSALFAVVMIAASGFVMIHLFHASAGNVSLRDMYVAVVIGFSTSLVFSVLQGLIIGIQRTDVQARLILLYNMLNAGGTVVVILLGWGLTGLAINWIAYVLITIVGNWLAAKRLYPAMRLNPFLFQRSELKRILTFSTKIQVSVIAIFLNQQVDRVLISYALGPASLGFYQLAQKATQQLQGFSSALTNTVLPAVSEMSTSGQWDRVRSLYVRATRYQAMTVFPLTAGLAGLSFPIMQAWLGPGFGLAAVTMIMLLASYAVYLPNGATVAALNGIGRPDVRMRGDIILVIVHIPLAALLIWRYGYFGTVAATSSLLVVSRLYIFIAGGRQLETPLRDLLRGAFVQPAIGSLLALSAVLLEQRIAPRETFVSLLGECVIFGGVYIGYMLLIGFDNEDVNLIRMAGRRLVPFGPWASALA